MATNYFDSVLITEEEKQTLKNRIEKNCTLNEGTGCLEWTKSKNSAGYPQCKLGKKFEDRFTPKPYSPVHILFSLEFAVVLKRNFYEISHLCHNKNCINVYHVNYEPSSINQSRKMCSKKNMCFAHGPYPRCIF